MCGTVHCDAQPSDIAQHNQYLWTDKPPYTHLVDKVLELNNPGDKNLHAEGGSITICMIGDSHGRFIAERGNALKVEHVHFAAETSRYPELFHVGALVNCTYAVINYGQWPLSFMMDDEPYGATRYEKEMRRVLSSVVAAKLTTQVFMGSMNMLPLGERAGSCPARDYRHSPSVMLYNNIMANLSTEYNIPYIDMIPLQGPLWDMSLDWNHPEASVLIAEAEFIIHSVLTYSLAHHRALYLDPDFAARVIPPFFAPTTRFSNGDPKSLYILHYGVYRAFPNDKTKRRMGTQWYGPTVINANHHADFEFGPCLPDL